MNPGEFGVTEPRLRRRSVLAAAWSVPVVMVAAASPARAASPVDPAAVLRIIDQPDLGFTIEVELTAEGLPVGGGFELQIGDETASAWTTIAAPTADETGWWTFVPYEEVPPGAYLLRAVFAGAPSAPVTVPPGPPTFTMAAYSVYEPVQQTTLTLTVVPPDGIPRAMPYTLLRQTGQDEWEDLGARTTDSNGFDEVIVPRVVRTALRVQVVLRGYVYNGDIVPEQP